MDRAILCLVVVLGCLAVSFTAGCSSATRATNPSFTISVEEAETRLSELRANPTEPARPVLLVGGYFDPNGTEIAGMKDQLDANFGQANVHKVRYFAFSDFDRLAAQLVAETDEAFGAGSNPAKTVAVDVVALSMGGLVARHAALVGDPQRGRKLNVQRLYTAGTPHRGAAWGTRLSLDALVRDMTPGSAFLKQLEAARPAAGYQIIPYVRLGDRIVGEANAAPPGETAIWLDSLPWQRPHADALHDPRIQADILLRLRGLPPLAKETRTPLPD